MQMIYIDSEDAARQTNMELALNTDAETWAQFKRYRSLDVDIKKATFLLDYYNRKGNLCHTICLDVAGFEKVTGQSAKTEAEYKQIDDDYWKEAKADYAKYKEDKNA